MKWLFERVSRREKRGTERLSPPTPTPHERRALAVAAARYLAAHFPARREREQTFTVASRPPPR